MRQRASIRSVNFAKRLLIEVAYLLVPMFASPNGLATTCGDSLTILTHFHGADTAAQAGISIGCLGDINRDGSSEVAISQYVPPGTNIVYGNTLHDSTMHQFVRGYFQGVIDLDGDGIKELVTSYVYDQSTAPRGIVYFYRGLSDSLASEPYDSLFTTSMNFGRGTSVAVGYADADSLGDLLVSQPNLPWGPALYHYSGCPTLDTVADWQFAITNASHYFSSFGYIDFNGDNNQDIYIGMHADLDSIGFVYVFLGPTYGVTPDIVISPPTNLSGFSKDRFAGYVTDIGDFNGSGWHDLGVLYGDQVLIYYCEPTSDSVYDLQLNGNAFAVAQGPDLNGDGWTDLLCGQTRTADGAIDIYLGGTSCDADFDCSIYRFDLPPALLQSIGYQVASAGDFNGDGIGDFMFSCRNFAGGRPGDVFVIAGNNGIVTGVDERGNTELRPTLSAPKNFPNPFNEGTSILFNLGRTEFVTIVVLNTLGQKVATVIDRQTFASGDHTVRWDGRTTNGNVAPSGVYYYVLTLDKMILGGKMLLLK